MKILFWIYALACAVLIFVSGVELGSGRRPEVREHIIYTPGKDDWEKLHQRHGYKQEDLMAELSNEKGVSLWSSSAGDLYVVYMSCATTDLMPQKITMETWVRGKS
jgi:hypothetical protein